MGNPDLADSKKVVDDDAQTTAPNIEEAIRMARDPELIEQAYRGDLSVIQQITASPFVLLCAFAAAVGGFSFGVDQGLMSVILTTRPFLDQFPEVDPDADSSASFWKGLMTAMLELGALLGAAQSGWFADKYSRKKALFFGVIWFIIGAILQVTSYSYAQLVVGRLVGGVGVGTLSAVAPVYNSEIAPPPIRGVMLCVEEYMIVLGIIFAYYVSYGTKDITSDWSFRIPFIVQMAPAISLGVCFFFLPYSPRWLVSVGRDQEAHDVLVRLRRLPHDNPLLLAELTTIKADAAAQRASQERRHPHLVNDKSFVAQAKLDGAGWIDCFRKSAIKRTHVSVGLGFFQQFVGINALIYYGPSLYAALGLKTDLQLHLAGAMNIAQLVGVTPAFFLLDKIGRRPLAIWGAGAMCVTHSIIAGLVATEGGNWASHSGEAWFCVALTFVYMIIFGLSWAPVPWVLPAEIFPTTLRAKGTALGTCSIWLNNFIIGLITPSLIDLMHGAGAFIFFAVFSFLGCVWSILFVPETKGRTLEAIDRAFNSSTATERQLEADALEGVIEELRQSQNVGTYTVDCDSSSSPTKDKKLDSNGGVVTLTTTP